jgi:hypothetical protein
MNIFIRTAILLMSIYTSNIALALDFSREAPPAIVTDGSASVGSRSVKLPSGEWTYLSHFSGKQSTLQGNAPVPWHSGYFAKATGNRFDIGLILTIADSNNLMRGWDADPCKSEGLIFRNEFDKTFAFPDCVLVNRRLSHLLGDVRPFMQPAKLWLEKNQIEPIGAVYEIVYARYAASGFGRISLFVPVAKFKDDASAIEWAKRVREQLKGLFENQLKEVELPTLP